MTSYSIRQIAQYSVLSLSLISLAQPAKADIYKCRAGNGKIEFSDSPCEKGSSETIITAKPNVLNSEQDRSAALKAENQRLTEENLRRQNDGLSQQLEDERGRGSDSREQAEIRANGASCQRARRDYETSTSSIKPSLEHLEALAASMRAACGIREPDKIYQETTINNNVNIGRQRTKVPVVILPENNQ